jgi:Sigma-70, region 4
MNARWPSDAPVGRSHEAVHQRVAGLGHTSSDKRPPGSSRRRLVEFDDRQVSGRPAARARSRCEAPPRAAMHQFAGSIDRAVERAPDQEPGADLAHVVIADRLAARIAKLGGTRRPSGRTVGGSSWRRRSASRIVGSIPSHRSHLRDALARLRPRQRRLLTMQAAGLRYEEMTAATGNSFRTVDRQLLRARAALRGALAA